MEIQSPLSGLWVALFTIAAKVWFPPILLKNSVFEAKREIFSPYKPSSQFSRGGRPNPRFGTAKRPQHLWTTIQSNIGSSRHLGGQTRASSFGAFRCNRKYGSRYRPLPHLAASFKYTQRRNARRQQAWKDRSESNPTKTQKKSSTGYRTFGELS